MPSKKGESNSFLLGRIYEKTKILPEIRQDIKEIKEKQISHHFRIKDLERAGVGFNFLRGIRLLLKFIK